MALALGRADGAANVRSVRVTGDAGSKRSKGGANVYQLEKTEVAEATPQVWGVKVSQQ